MLGLSLPVDIPWKRLSTSEDMILRGGAGLYNRLTRWRSSLSVFGYEPGPDYQTYDGMTVSYLKVVASLTGFQPDPDEVGLKDRRAYQGWLDPDVIEHYRQVASKYYACYGAILKVAVTPSGTPEEVRKIPLDQYPYFADFEPKKRELYEVVTDTGEMMSRSLEDVNVRKGATTSDSHEILDIFGGANMQVAATLPSGAGASVGGGFQGQWGTHDIGQQGFENVRTTDSGRESRETYSHSTQITQMYHQLDSYHLGTNRAVFYVLPRPHVVETERTFVNGPRVLEGIQEFFLVVMRPNSMKNICVEAYLETAHLADNPVLEHEQSTGKVELHMSLKAPRPDEKTRFDDSITIVSTPEISTFTPPDGWEVDFEPDASRRPTQRPSQGRDPNQSPAPVPRSSLGYHIDFEDGAGVRHKNVDPQADQVTLTGVVEARFFDKRRSGHDEFIDGRLDMVVTVFTRKKTPTVVDNDYDLWLTGRYVSTCPAAQAAKGRARDSVVLEQPLKGVPAARIGSKMSIGDANAFRTHIGRALIRSIDHPDRRALGDVSFSEAGFVSRPLAKMISAGGHADNAALAQMKTLPPAVAAKIAKVAPNIMRAQLLAMSMEEQRDRLGLTPEESSQVRRSALGLAGAAPDAATRWNRTLLPVYKPLPKS